MIAAIPVCSALLLVRRRPTNVSGTNADAAASVT
jgi:hypothetical protein